MSESKIPSKGELYRGMFYCLVGLLLNLGMVVFAVPISGYVGTVATVGDALNGVVAFILRFGGTMMVLVSAMGFGQYFLAVRRM